MTDLQGNERYSDWRSHLVGMTLERLEALHQEFKQRWIASESVGEKYPLHRVTQAASTLTLAPRVRGRKGLDTVADVIAGWPDEKVLTEKLIAALNELAFQLANVSEDPASW